MDRKMRSGRKETRRENERERIKDLGRGGGILGRRGIDGESRGDVEVEGMGYGVRGSGGEGGS